MNELELYHHGIKGQRWGIRRYTNPDGTLNEAGKKRYGSDVNTKKEWKQKKETWNVIDVRKSQRLISYMV